MLVFAFSKVAATEENQCFTFLPIPYLAYTSRAVIFAVYWPLES